MKHMLQCIIWSEHLNQILHRSRNIRCVYSLTPNSTTSFGQLKCFFKSVYFHFFQCAVQEDTERTDQSTLMINTLHSDNKWPAVMGTSSEDRLANQTSAKCISLPLMVNRPAESQSNHVSYKTNYWEGMWLHCVIGFYFCTIFVVRSVL